MHFCQKKPFRGSRRGCGQSSLWGGEEYLKVVDGPPATGYVHHGTHEVPDHMVQESVGCDFKSQAQLAPRDPLSLRYLASVTSRFLSDFRKALERMLAEDEGRPPMEKVDIQFTKERPAPRPMEG